MVIVKLSGGLGNQMFQYAAAKAVSLQNAVPLKLYVGHFTKPVKNETRRAFRLNVFPAINEEFATEQEVKRLAPVFSSYFLKKLYRLMAKMLPAIKPAHIVEKDLCHSPIILTKTKNIFLDGYWQSERYFDTAANQIRAVFNLNHLRESVSLQSVISLIESHLSVSIHVRRGDYATNPTAQAYHGLLSQQYYNRCIASMVELFSEEPFFFIFSDDLDWCKQNLHVGTKHIFVSTSQDYHDLYLMSLCKHNIIANSSFSWWAAWLNNHSGKIVMAPKHWFNGNTLNDIVPRHWKTMI